MTVDDLSLNVPDVVIADSNFFNVFNFPLLQGDPRSALVEPMSIVLSQSTTKRFFGNSNPLGQTIRSFRNQICTITGIVEDVPANSHLQYQALISWSSTVPGVGPLNIHWLNNWRTQVNLTYLLLRENADPIRFEAGLSEFMHRHMPEQAEKYKLYLQPYSGIYLNSSDIRYTANTKVGNRTYVYVFSVIAFLILTIACFNFINLSTAQATRRASEVGMRKILGGYRKQLIFQFLFESTLFTSLAVFIALVLTEILLPYVNTFVAKSLSLGYFNTPIFLLLFVAVATLVGIGAGSYPAFVLSSFRPFHTIKKYGSAARKTVFTRKLLAISQFKITVVLIIGTIVVYRQLQYIDNKNLGFQKDQLIILPIGNTSISEQFQAFKSELLRHSGILYAAGSNSIPGEGTMSFAIRPEGVPEEENWIVHSIRVDDFDFLSTYKMEMAAGRYFSPEYSTDATNRVVINEMLAKSLGWKDAVGKRLDIEGELENGRVIGVVKDFHMRSLHHTIEPLLIYFAPHYENLTLRISRDDIFGTIRFLQNKWQEFEQRYPFEYHFLDQKLDQLYRSETKLKTIFVIFSTLAIFIACLGLLALAAFSAQQRSKEIGIRKVHGASVLNVTALLSKDFIKLVLLANLISWPIAWYVMNKWLQNFAYHIAIGWSIFTLTGSLTLIIAIFTVGTQAIRAANANPVEALRYE